MTNIVILAAGRVKTESNSEVSFPACLTELDGLSVLERIVRNLKKVPDACYTFALHAQDTSDFHLDNIVKLLMPAARITVVPESTSGSACTALLATCELNSEQPLLIISANELVDQAFETILQSFIERGLDAGAIGFRSVHPRYSYVKLNKSGLITEVAQQNPISQIATAGVFWYRQTFDFIDAAKCAIRKNASTNGAFYLATVFNELILKQKKIGIHEIANINYIPLKTVLQIKQYEGGKS